jgi:rhomboid protease GluP
MANCVSCGIQLPVASSAKSDRGTSDNVCVDCRKMAAQPVVLSPDGVVLPTQTQRRPRSFSIRLSVTTVLVGINVAVFVAMALTGVSLAQPNSQQLIKWGANFGPLSLGPQPWRILASNYLHIGIIHIFFNMWCLLNLGALAERVFDRWTYVVVYTVSGIAGSLGSLWWHPAVIGAGASGAIFGLAGALMAALYLGKLPIPREAVQSTMKSLLMFAGYNLFFGLAGGIDNAAHIGGLAGGIALGAFFSRHLTDAPETRRLWRIYAIVGSGVIFAIAFRALQKLYGLPSR